MNAEMVEELAKWPCLSVEHDEVNCMVAGLPPEQWCESCTARARKKLGLK